MRNEAWVGGGADIVVKGCRYVYLSIHVALSKLEVCIVGKCNLVC